MKQRFWSVAVATVAVVSVAIGANTPAQARAGLHSHGWLHPWFHLAIFGTIAWLLTRATQSPRLQVLLLVGVGVFGAATEYVEYRYHDALFFEYGDVVLDSIGALLGTGVAVLVQRRALRRSEGSWE